MSWGPSEADRAAEALGWEPEPGESVWVRWSTPHDEHWLPATIEERRHGLITREDLTEQVDPSYRVRLLTAAQGSEWWEVSRWRLLPRASLLTPARELTK